jgi:hypothetical protein
MDMIDPLSKTIRNLAKAKSHFPAAVSAIGTILYANLRFWTISCAIARCWASTLARGAIMQDAHTIVAQARMQSCDQYGRILLVSGFISKESPQRSASFLVRCRFGVARGRLWRKAVVRSMGDLWNAFERRSVTAGSPAAPSSEGLSSASQLIYKPLALLSWVRGCRKFN